MNLLKQNIMSHILSFLIFVYEFVRIYNYNVALNKQNKKEDIFIVPNEKSTYFMYVFCK